MSVLTKEHQDILRRHLKATGHQVLRDFFDTIDARDAKIAALRERIEALAEKWKWAASLKSELPESKAQQAGWYQCADELLAALDANTGTSSIAACNGQTRMSLPAFLDTDSEREANFGAEEDFSTH